MEEILYYTVLFDLYGLLLTEKQQKYFQDYYFSNLSLGEIADHYQVSRNAIYNQLKEVRESLNHYEAILHLKEKYEKLENLFEGRKEDQLQKRIKEILEI